MILSYTDKTIPGRYIIIMKRKPLKFEDLTLEQKLGMMLVRRSAFIDDEDIEFTLEMIKKHAVGGIQLAPNPELMKRIDEVLDYPLLICYDMETGYPGGNVRHPALIALGAVNDEEMIYQNAYLTALEAKKAGYNTIWGPVVDACNEGALCCISRTFGDDHKFIAKYAKAIVKGYSDAGVIATCKHYPSPYGGKDDSHMRSFPSKLTTQELENTSLLPYLEVMNSVGLPAIMTIHTVFENIDPDFPATLSSKVISLIREKGFDGVIFTDSLAMMAIVHEYGDVGSIGMAAAAGCDLILPNYRLSYKQSYEAIKEAYEKGILTEERLNESVKRVLKAQEFTLKMPDDDFKNVEERHIEVVEKLTEKSLCFLDRANVGPALPKDGKKLFVLSSEMTYPYDSEESKELLKMNSHSYEKVLEHKRRILEEFPDAEVIIISEYPNQTQNERVLDAAAHADHTIFFTFCLMSSYVGSDAITDRLEYLINSCDNVSAVFHVGNPYEAKKFKNAQRIFVGHDGGDYLGFTLKALKGEFTPTGKLPVKFNIDD